MSLFKILFGGGERSFNMYTQSDGKARLMDHVTVIFILFYFSPPSRILAWIHAACSLHGKSVIKCWHSSQSLRMCSVLPHHHHHYVQHVHFQKGIFNQIMSCSSGFKLQSSPSHDPCFFKLTPRFCRRLKFDKKCHIQKTLPVSFNDIAHNF